MHVSPVLDSAQNGRIFTVAQQNAPMRHLCIDSRCVFCHISGCTWPILIVQSMHVSPTSLAVIPVLGSAQNGRVFTVVQQNASMRHLCNIRKGQNGLHLHQPFGIKEMPRGNMIKTRERELVLLSPDLSLLSPWILVLVWVKGCIV